MLKFLLLLLTFLPVQDRLDPWYRGFNQKYFQDRLPAAIITHDLKDDRYMAITEIVGQTYHIAFNPRYNQSPVQERENLLHEMCHVEVYTEGDEFDAHGMKWQHCMHRLADEKALENVW